MREIEAQPVGRDERALLRHVRTQHLAQCLVQEVRRRVVGARRRAARVLDLEIDLVARFERTLLDLSLMHEQAAGLLLRIGDAEQRLALAADDALIADLAAGFAVERRLVDDDRRLVAGLEAFHLLAVLDESDDLARRGLRLVAEELGRAGLLLQLEPDRLGRRLAGALPRLARLGLLPLHRRAEGLGVDADAARAQRVLGQVEGKAEGVVELERGVAGQHRALLEIAGRVLEQPEALFKRPLEALLFELERLGNERLRTLQLVIGVAHLVHERRHEPIH